MVQHKPTPEEQLLKLIEGGSADASKPASSSFSEKTPAGKSKGVAAIGKIPGFLDYAKQTFLKGGSSRWSPAFAFDIKTLNRVLAGLVIAAIIFLGVDLVFFKPGKNNLLAQVSTSDAVYPVHLGAPGKISSDISAYKITAQKRNPFLPPQAVVLRGPADSGKAGTAAPAGATGTIAEALQGIKLVGISWSDNPLAMIEDVSSGRTYFLRKGQEIKGIKVQDISKEKVSVTYQGQESELF